MNAEPILYLHAGAEMYGADKVLLDLVTKLDKNLYTPYVILPCFGVLYDELKKHDINVEVIEYPILRRKYFTPKGIFEFLTNYIHYSKLILKKAKEYKTKLVHVNTAAVLEGIYLKRYMDLHLIWSIHEIIMKPKIVYKTTSYLIGKYANLVVTDSEAVKAHLVASKCIEENIIKVIYNGVDEQRFVPSAKPDYLLNDFNIPKSAIIVGMIARVNAWKGQRDFLEALELVMEKDERVIAFLVGDTFEGEEWRYKELDDYIRKSKFYDRIRMTGYRNDSEYIYNLYDILILPSINPDPLPTVVLEAMACGKPIISYRHGGACEMIKENYNGLFADIKSTKDLADKILYLLSNKELINKYGKNSRVRLLNHFSMSSYIKNYSESYALQLRKIKS